MDRGVSDDGPEDYIIVVPHAWRDDGLLRDIQAKTQVRIGTTLREMYADLGWNCREFRVGPLR
jgi:hypothetical protein